MQEKEKITAWVTKYALSSGIDRVEAEVCHYINSGMITYGSHQVAHGNDWHRAPGAALQRAQEMRTKKIDSLKKNIAKLEKLTFSIPE